MKLYAFRFMIRSSPDFNTLHRFRKLMQQFVVDMYAKVETERLRFVGSCQRNCVLNHMLNSLMHFCKVGFTLDTVCAIVENSLFSRRCKSSKHWSKSHPPQFFCRGPRYMHEWTHNAMSYVRKLGRPSLFVTMTCNPSWPEITNELFYGQLPHHRPDIDARVFHLKQRALMAQITICRIFGDVIAYVCSIEWQKRGLPHAHILVWLAAKNKIHANLIYFVISAEISEKATNPRLHKIVMANMIHGLCGPLNKNLPCMVDNYCSKHFPKNFCRETQYSNDGYPLYRRRSPDEGGYTGVKKLKAKTIRSTTDV